MNISGDPCFIYYTDYHLPDCHLRDWSPCIDAGNPNVGPTTDIEGNLRPNPPGSKPDM
ncbi:choice-of-anchor Q domain-containing protein, partial [Candidatus Poribacteria bacterium]